MLGMSTGRDLSRAPHWLKKDCAVTGRYHGAVRVVVYFGKVYHKGAVGSKKIWACVTVVAGVPRRY